MTTVDKSPHEATGFRGCISGITAVSDLLEELLLVIGGGHIFILSAVVRLEIIILGLKMFRELAGSQLLFRSKRLSRVIIGIEGQQVGFRAEDPSRQAGGVTGEA